jgi:hypothetical protein
MSDRLAAWVQQWRAPARPTPVVPSSRVQLPVARNLILVNQPGWQATTDWQAIAEHVRDFDPRIETFVVNATMPNSYTRRKAADRPTLVCSPAPLTKFAPARGRVYQGRVIPKLEQLRLLSLAGVPAPRTTVLRPETRLDPAEWGEFVIVKPTDLASSSHGNGIQLMRTSRVRYTSPRDYPADHPGRRGPMVVQRFVNTGNYVSLFRVLTLFGEPLYSAWFHSREPRVPLDASDEDIERGVIATQGLTARETDFIAPEGVLAMARRADAAIPDVPLKGCDIVREEATGALYVLEVNPGGNTWHFSSGILAEQRARRGPEHEQRRMRQFDAFRAAARALVARTNAEAE